MEILLILIPLSVTLGLGVLVALWWAVNSDQFDDLEAQGQRIVDED
jgi:cbb3-type cytochrome oxidase maturation protein